MKELTGGKLALVGVAILLIALPLFLVAHPAKPDPKWLLQRQPLALTQPTQLQTRNLAVLCKVWGLATYYHPYLATGALDCDQQLLSLILPVASCTTKQEADQLLTDWIEGLGPVSSSPQKATQDLSLRPAPDTRWLQEGTISPALSTPLTALLESDIFQRKNGPAYIDYTVIVSFANQHSYRDMNYADAGMRLLGLFRYWNAIQYYFPYREDMEEDWAQVLEREIPRFLLEQDERSYKLAVAALTTRLSDSHGQVRDPKGTLAGHWGQWIAPINFLMIEGQVVVSALPSSAAESPVKPGDVITHIDGVPTAEVIAQKLQYISLSGEDKLNLGLSAMLLRTKEQMLPLTLLREGAVVEVVVECVTNDARKRVQKPSWELLEGNIGLINPGFLKKGELPNILPKLRDTKGLIVDFRQYPAEFILYTLGEYLLPAPVPFAEVVFPYPALPGGFMAAPLMMVGKDNPNYYKGQVVLLMDENTISQGEFTIMALKKAPGAIIVGSPSVGADGNVIELPLPGGLSVFYTGLGVYHPDGSKTQRVGLSPDVLVYPTIEELSQGRDALLERGIQLIQEVG